MRNCLKTALLTAICAAAACLGGDPAVGAHCGFDSKSELLKNGQIIGSVTVQRQAQFHFVDEPTAKNGKALVVEANNASGFLIFRLAGLDLKKYPYMRWRWRVIRRINLPIATEEPDDQVCAVYIADGSKVSQKCVSYRWEHYTNVGVCRMLNYSGVRRVQAFCLRNFGTPAGEWVEEERNVLEDFQKAFGKAPSANFVIIVSGNSQNTKSDTRAEIDYIEFRSAPKSAK